jgi:hypothetical protein
MREGHPHILSVNGEDYEKHWNYVDFKDKVVLDLGADHGSTVSFFFQKGAKKVIAVEGDLNEFKKLQYIFGNDKDVTCILLWIDTPGHFIDLFTKYNPDIVKIDIEGNEKFLLDIPQEVFRSIKEYLIEIHSGLLKDQFVFKLSDYSYSISVEYARPRTEVLVGIRI